MKKKIFIPLATIAFFLIGIRVGTTSAYFISEDKVTNNFENANVDIEVDEEFEEPNNWIGTKVDKVVRVENKSTVPVLVRVSITPSWSNDKDGNEPFLGNISESVIKLNFEDTNGNSNLTNSIDVAKKWIKGNDGYYYYTSALEIEDEMDSEKNKTSVLLESVQAIINESTVGEEFVNLYADKYLQVDVKSEAIQISEKSYVDIWNITDKNIISLLDKIVDDNISQKNGGV